jgi:TetR/AcrR family transcriptional regulator, tetracycline repressor protein
LETALRIIDTDGIEAMSIRRLASDLGVNGASLYHHFANKDAILVGATELALSRTPVQVRSDSRRDWRHWLLRGVRQLLDLLVSHPGLTPIIVERRSFGVSTDTLEAITQKLLAQGVPAPVIMPMYEALERFVIGTAFRQVRSETVLADSHGNDAFPHLRLATATHDETAHDVVFDQVALGIMDALVAYRPAHEG